MDFYARKEKATNRLKSILIVDSNSKSKNGIEISSLKILFLQEFGMPINKLIKQFEEAGQCIIKDGKVYGLFKKDNFIDKWSRKAEND